MTISKSRQIESAHLKKTGKTISQAHIGPIWPRGRKYQFSNRLNTCYIPLPLPDIEPEAEFMRNEKVLAPFSPKKKVFTPLFSLEKNCWPPLLVYQKNSSPHFFVLKKVLAPFFIPEKNTQYPLFFAEKNSAPPFFFAEKSWHPLFFR